MCAAIRRDAQLDPIELWEEIGRAHGEISATIRPASSMIEVPGPIAPSLIVEIETTAVVAPAR